MDSSSRQRASTQRAISEEVFGEKQHSSDGTSAVLSGPSTVRLFPLPENQVCAQRNQVWVRGCSENKSDATLEQHNTRWPPAVLPSNSGKFAWSGVGIREGTALKGITFRLSDFFFNKGLEHESRFFIATPRILLTCCPQNPSNAYNLTKKHICIYEIFRQSSPP